MFEVRSLQDALKPLFIVSTVLGLASPHHRKGRTMYFILHHLYNSAIFFFHCFSCFIIIKPTLELFSVKSSEAASLIIFTLATYGTPLTAILTSLWVSYIRGHNVLKRIERVDCILINKPLHKYRRIRQVILTLIVFFALWISVEVVVCAKQYWQDWIVLYLVYYINMIVAINSAIVVMLLYTQFKNLNEMLLSAVSLGLKREGSLTYGRGMCLVDCPTIINHAIPRKFWNKNSMLNDGAFIKTNHNSREYYDERIDALTCLRRIHRHLVKVAESINSHHGVVYVTLVLEAVIGTVVAIFMFFQMVKFRIDGMILSLTSAVVRSLLKTSSISFACEWTSKEAGRTGAILQDLILEEKELVPSLQLFAEQLKHTGVQFNACGFFPIGGSSMSGVIASVVTYSIILIQFVISEKSGSTNTTCACTQLE